MRPPFRTMLEAAQLCVVQRLQGWSTLTVTANSRPINGHPGGFRNISYGVGVSAIYSDVQRSASIQINMYCFKKKGSEKGFCSHTWGCYMQSNNRRSNYKLRRKKKKVCTKPHAIQFIHDVHQIEFTSLAGLKWSSSDSAVNSCVVLLLTFGYAHVCKYNKKKVQGNIHMFS